MGPPPPEDPVSRPSLPYTRRVRLVRQAGWSAALLLLVVGTVMVFLAFDRNSHSASDTLRPFLITMAPVWFVFVLGTRAALRR